MRTAIRRVLEEDVRIEVVGDASTFVQVMQMIEKCEPQVLLIDLHLPEKSDFTPSFVRNQLGRVKHILAISISNDEEAKSLASSYGVETLLDKMNLYAELGPAILASARNLPNLTLGRV